VVSLGSEREPLTDHAHSPTRLGTDRSPALRIASNLDMTARISRAWMFEERHIYDDWMTTSGCCTISGSNKIARTTIPLPLRPASSVYALGIDPPLAEVPPIPLRWGPCRTFDSKMPSNPLNFPIEVSNVRCRVSFRA
jgi:hypothetical protein